MARSCPTGVADVGGVVSWCWRCCLASAVFVAVDGAADPALVAGAAVVVAVCYCCCSFGFPRLRCRTGLWRPPPHTPQSGVEQCRRRVRLSQRGQAPPTPLFALCHEGLFFFVPPINQLCFQFYVFSSSCSPYFVFRFLSFHCPLPLLLFHDFFFFFFSRRFCDISRFIGFAPSNSSSSSRSLSLFG